MLMKLTPEGEILEDFSLFTECIIRLSLDKCSETIIFVSLVTTFNMNNKFSNSSVVT